MEQITNEEKYLCYLKTHIANVKKSYEIIKNIIPEIFSQLSNEEILQLEENIENHDKSKFEKESLKAYADHFMGNFWDMNDDYLKALNNHFKTSPHHFQYWVVMVNSQNFRVLEMDLIYILEMFCDWFSFAIYHNNPRETKKWFYNHEHKMLFGVKTKELICYFLDKLDDYCIKNYSEKFV